MSRNALLLATGCAAMSVSVAAFLGSCRSTVVDTRAPRHPGNDGAVSEVGTGDARTTRGSAERHGLYVSVAPDGSHELRRIAASQPGEHYLFQRWFQGMWLEARSYKDVRGKYLYIDKPMNVVFLVIAEQAGLPPWVKDATAEEATLFPGSSHEMRIRPKRNCLTVVLPDRRQLEFSLTPHGATELFESLAEYAGSRADYSVVKELLKHYGASIDPKLKGVLEAYP